MMATRKFPEVKKHRSFKFAFKHNDSELIRSESNIRSLVYQSGPNGEMRSKIVDLINSAKEHICICTFILADSSIEKAIIEATQRGVRTYILTNAELKLKPGQDDDEWSWEDEQRDSHKDLLSRLTGQAYLRSAQHYHAKYLVVDSNRGMITTCNFTEKALLESPELGIVLNEDECRELRHEFIYQFWERADNELVTPKTLKGVREEGRFKTKVPESNLRLAHGQPFLEECLKVIKSANSSVVATSFSWGNNLIADSLIARAKDGLEVKIIGRDHRGPKQTEHLQKLCDSGCTVIGLRNIHAKCVLGDLNTENFNGIVMSANLDEHLTGSHVGISPLFSTVHKYFGSTHDMGICIPDSESKRMVEIINQWVDAGSPMIQTTRHRKEDGDLWVFNEKSGWRGINLVEDD